jgi:hypothetical protein
MVVPSRSGLSAAVAAAVMLSAPVMLGGGVKAEERINWLKTPAAVAIPAQPAAPDLPISLSSRGSVGHFGVQDRRL